MFKQLQLSSFALLLLFANSAIAAPASTSSCSRGASAGYVSPRLKVGGTGHSVLTRNLRIRIQPGVNSKIIGSLSPRTTFKVLQGPECKNGYVWWKVNNSRLQGWVAEADPATFKYWLAPGSK